jgi:hypothetical protein
MKSLFVLILGFLMLTGCHKSEEKIIVPEVEIENNIVFLDVNHKVVKIFTTGDNNAFIREINYNYTDSIVLIRLYNSSSNYQNSIYAIGKNGFAEYSKHPLIDPSYPIRWDSVIYKYDSEGYLTSSTSFPGDQTLEYNYENGDLHNFENLTFSYYDTLNKVELFWFGTSFFPYGNGITGKSNAHLVRQIYWDVAHGAEIWDFSYKIDTNGYVSEQNEIDEYRHHYLKRFTYFFNYAP